MTCQLFIYVEASTLSVFVNLFVVSTDYVNEGNELSIYQFSSVQNMLS